jgi:hypothetical protein
MALKMQEHCVNPYSMPVGGTAIAANSVCKISSSALVVGTASTEAASCHITYEAGAANGTVGCYGVGSIVLVNAHDADLAEGEYWVPAASGRVDSIAALTGATQYYLGIGLQASSAQDQKCAMLYCPGIAPKATA